MPTPVSPENAGITQNTETSAPQKTDGNEPAIKNGEPAPILFSRNKWMKLFNKGDYDGLTADFVRILHHFVNTNYTGLSAERQATINDFVETFLFFFCHPDYKLPLQYAQTFMTLHPLICNVVAMSDFKTTTPWVYRMMLGKENFIKLLVLYNARSDAPIDPKRVFDANPFVASEWWSYYCSSVIAFCTKELHDKIRAHLTSLDDRFMIFGAESRGSYFPVTYVAPDLEQSSKERINRLSTKAFTNVAIRNKPNRKKIAIASSRWYRSAVYTSLSPLIKSLKDRYDLTLIHYGTDENRILDRDMFERVICIRLKKEQINLEALQDNEFSALIYPDVGMHAESIFLSNIRIAPVQICMYGHPSSTWSTQMDYFIGGQKVEPPQNAEKHYSERLVLIPGLGVYPVYPEHFTVPAKQASKDPMIINCGWSAQKLTYPLFAALQDIIKKANKKIIFRIFSGGAGNENALIPMIKDINSMLGAENVQVMPGMVQLDYLASLCEGTFSIDSWPFGGFNTIVDALYCKKPVVAWQGDRAFNRFTAATLTMIGMPEVIAHSYDEYVEIVSRMINDDEFRNQQAAKVANLDLKSAFAKEENPEYFLKAVDYLIDNNNRLKNEGHKNPILID